MEAPTVSNLFGFVTFEREESAALALADGKVSFPKVAGDVQHADSDQADIAEYNEAEIIKFIQKP